MSGHTASAADLLPLLREAIRTGDDLLLRTRLVAASGLPGPRLNLRLVDAFGAAVALELTGPTAEVDSPERLLDGWAALPVTHAPGDAPEVVLPCAAVSGYGWAAVTRPQWWADEMVKLAAAAADPRWRVRELVAAALQRVLSADWARTATMLTSWAAGPDPLLVRAAVAAVAEPALLTDPTRPTAAADIQRVAVATFGAIPRAARRADGVRALRRALAFTLSVVAAASGDFALLMELAAVADPDLQWILRQNLGKARLRRWPDELATLTELAALGAAPPGR